MEDQKTCVYMLKKNQAFTNDLKSAQDYAVNEGASLVALKVINPDKSDIYKELGNSIHQEEQLASKNIKLIILIDSKGEKLAAALDSLKPVKIFMDESDQLAQIDVHPYEWNGTVMPISELMKLNESELCL